MPRQQINIKLPPELIETLRERALTQEITLTELIQGYCEQGLGLPPSNHQPVDTALIYERILTEVDNRISTHLDIRIPKLEDPLLNQLEQRIAFMVDARISSQIALLEQRMATQLGEHIREGFSRACELGRELERSKWQSPLSIEPAIVEDVIPSDNEQLDRKQLGKLLGISHETVRLWGKDGKLADLGWELVPGTGTNPKNPFLYRRSTP